MKHINTVRAVDVGYGHVKFSNGYAEDGAILVESFPSQSPEAADDQLVDETLQQRDTFLVPVGRRIFEVGRNVADCMESNEESAILNAKFSLSEAYAARLFGAINYMSANLPDNVVKGDRHHHYQIDQLVLGLPMTTYSNYKSEMATRFAGQHIINTRGDTVSIDHCKVYPQPLGGYIDFLESHDYPTPPKALIIDPGFNTVDWFVCEGMTVSGFRSHAVKRGMSAVMKKIATKIINSMKMDGGGLAELTRMLDSALTQGTPLELRGVPVDLAEFMSAGDTVISQAAQAVKNAIDEGLDIKMIVIVGGGASFYADAFTTHFSHPVVVSDNPAFANVRGFQALGERLADSARRALGGGIAR